MGHSTNVKDQHGNIRKYSKRRRKKPQQKYQQTGSIGRQRGIQRGNVNSGRIVTGVEIWKRVLNIGSQRPQRQHRKRTAVTSTSEANGYNVNKYNNNRNIELRACKQKRNNLELLKTPAIFGRRFPLYHLSFAFSRCFAFSQSLLA